MKFNRFSGVLFGMLVQSLLIQPAFARLEERPTRAPQSEREQIAIVQIQGKLQCNTVTVNGNSVCELRLIENGTGRVLKLAGSNEATAEAMRLYQTGATTVALKGTIQNSDTVQVSSAEAI